MRAAVYLRVSTEKQDEKNQEPDCLRVCAARGWEPFVLREKESGATMNRPVWNQVMDEAHRGRIGAVVVWSIDRIGRSMFELIDDVRELDRVGVQVVSVKETWLDTGGPARDLLLPIFAWVAHQQRTKLRDQTRAGLARARAAGRVGGRRWTNIPPASWDIVAAGRELGLGYHTIAKRIEEAFGEKYDPAVIRRAFLKSCAKGVENGG